MASTPEGFTDESPVSTMELRPVKKPSAIKYCVCSLTNYMWKIKLLPVELDLLNQSAKKLYMEIYHGHGGKVKRKFKNKWSDREVSLKLDHA